MGIVAYIDGIPTFSTQVEALAWGSQHGGIQGFHTHIVDEQTTYMAGINHNAITSAYTPIQNNLAANATPEQLLMVEPVSMPVIPPTITTQQVIQQVSQPMAQPIQQPVQQPMAQPVQQPVQPAAPVYVPPTGGGSGGGGGGGY